MREGISCNISCDIVRRALLLGEPWVIGVVDKPFPGDALGVRLFHALRPAVTRDVQLEVLRLVSPIVMPSSYA